MALRDQPYLPLYIQDFLTDEKLIECSAQSTGVYVRLMCIMHKSEEYGKILLKQKDKQSTEQIKNFACKIAKQMPYSFEVVASSLAELLAENVLYIEGDFLCQKRMIKDNSVSLVRSKAGKKGGDFAQAKIKAKVQANTENEIVIEFDNEIDNILNRALDEIYLDQQKPKWPHIDFDFEVNSFKEKVRGSPEHYRNHDSSGLRLAFQSQLRNAKKKFNGTSKAIDTANEINSLITAKYGKPTGT